MPASPTLTEGDVTLSPLVPEDVDAHLAGEDAELVRWLNGGTGDRAATEEHVRYCGAQWAGGGPLRAFGLRVGSPPVLAGTIDLRFGMPGLDSDQVNIAYGLYPAWRGRGLATRAVRLACRYAAAEGAAEGVIQVDPANPRSAAVAVRAGFSYVMQVRRLDGGLFDRYVRDLARDAEPGA
ncbi:GNAT family N-acetyltransferase [Streptomyces avicenniae]|uniref:GNAT family N-acetyltransferase n=1 Tax=Streptomyces avicenniae TaxID=500153 RepID=UPI00069A9483|nr:GNAT family N-acetyltransferase [Streptomyces avicenniae]